MEGLCLVFKLCMGVCVWGENKVLGGVSITL